MVFIYFNVSLGERERERERDVCSGIVRYYRYYNSDG